LGNLDTTVKCHPVYLKFMIQRTVTHLALVSKSAQSLKTTIPRSVVKKLKLQQSDMLEWLETSKGDIVVRRL
jgi:hypothetical protein